MINVFIIGSKGIPAKYGGFETFVDKLIENQKDINIKYYVACMSDKLSEFEYNNAKCINIPVKNIGAAKAVIYDLKALKWSLEYIKKNNLENCIIYILACRIGPFINKYKKIMDKRGIKLVINPDGHEWKRSKWNKLIKLYWKISEKYMIKNSDLIICDSKCIEEYIKSTYINYEPKTTFIAYGADINKSNLEDESMELKTFYFRNDLIKNNYYLIVGRFVPENNYELIIKEFMKSNTNKDLVIVTNIEKNKFYDVLEKNTNFYNDKRIKFVGTIYNKELLKKIRENAFAYIHGHEVGGTNPSLLEALASTKINILIDVNFNREVADNGALYFNKEMGNLSNLIDRIDMLPNDEIKILSEKAKERIIKNYTWDIIVDKYENLFKNIMGNR